MPPWVERARLYFSLDRFGVDGAAAVIEAKRQELGLAPAVEGPRERAQRLQRSLDFKAEKHAFVHGRGAEAGQTAFYNVIELIKSAVRDASASNIGLRQMKMEQYDSWLLFGLGPFLVFNWTNRYSNVLENAFMEAQFYRNQPSLPALMTWKTPQKMKHLKYEFDLLTPGVSGFVERGGRREFSESELAEHIFKIYLDEAEKFKVR